MDDDVGNVRRSDVEESKNEAQGNCGEGKAARRGESHQGVELSEGESYKEGAEISHRSVLKGAHPSSSGEAIGGPREVIWVRKVVVGVRGKTDQPEEQDYPDETGRSVEEGSVSGPDTQYIGEEQIKH